MASITLRHVTKRFDDVTAVDSFELTIDDGEFVALLGPSGCGKSTLLRLIAGLETLTAGEIAIADRVVNDIPGKRRDVAMVFQNYALYPQMTVRQNMAFPLSLRGTPKSEVPALVEEMARLLELSELLDRKPNELSGGQQQRVAMARALVRRPSVLLMDEPLSNLDARLRDQMRSDIRDLQRDIGVTTIYVTHDQTEAMTMADRVVVMRDGVLQQAATPWDLYHRPSNTFVASFVGSPPRTLLEGRLAAGRLSVGDQALSDPAHGALSGRGERRVTVGIRPESLAIVELDCSDDLDVLVATVRSAEPLGSETLLRLTLGPSASAGPVLRLKLLGSYRYDRGESVNLGVGPGNVDLFDAETGELLYVASATGSEVD